MEKFSQLVIDDAIGCCHFWFGRFRKFFDKFPSHVRARSALSTFLIVVLVVAQFASFSPAYAATYTFTQSSWAGGATANTGVHPTNQSSWTQYSSASSTMTIGTTVALATTASTTIQTSDTDFSAGTNSSTAVTGSGASGSVVLSSSGITATGGTITTSGANTIHTFTSSGTFTPSGSANVAVLVVAGGGGGGDGSGGGGGGGLTYNSTFAVTAQAYTVTVGSGGDIAGTGGDGFSGGNSVFSTITTTGGGGGAGHDRNGVAGGSGGGGGDGSTRTGGAGTSGQGNTGGTSNNDFYSGGGGGSGAVGANGVASPRTGGAGGAGLQYSISGTATYYAGGGGGGTYQGGGTSGAGGIGGGGAGGAGSGNTTINGTNGTANTGGGGGGRNSSGLGTAGSGGSGVVIISYAQTYSSSGTFTSSIIDTTANVVSWGNLSWTSSGTGTITLKARSSSSSSMTGATAFSSCTNITSGAALSTGGCVTNGDRYVQYQASLSTSDTTVTPSLDSVTVGYNLYPTTAQTLISSAYDASDATNVIGGFAWDEDATLPSGTTVTVSLRTASSANGLTTASWTDFTNATTNCSKSSVTVTCTSSAIPSAMKDGSGDQWFQYKIALSSTGANTPTVTRAQVTYVVNAAPAFDSTYGNAGALVSQVATTTDANWGKVSIGYSVKDADTSTGTTNPGYITPTFEYSTNGGSSWTSITSQYLASGDASNKAVSGSSYTTYTAIWDAKTQIPTNYSATAQVRIKANDNEAANNLATATSSNFTLDTTNPSNTFLLDGTAGTVSLTSTDNSTILDYSISNSSTLASATTGSGTSTTLGLTPSWTFSNATTSTTVYARVRDIYGNTSTSTSVGPIAPASLDIRDVSNNNTGQYQEFILWPVYPTVSGATFSKYEIYRSTDGSTYSLLTTITNSANNYYVDTSVSSSTTYYYKVRQVDTDGDKSGYTSVVSDLPDGQGGTDNTAPTISSVAISEIKNTSAKVTWTTDELSNSQVNYGLTSSYGSTASASSYVTSHAVYITNLLPNTAYYVRAKSTDISSNLGTNDNSGASYTFTTTGGTVISNVTVTDIADTQATVFWNSTTASDSYVDYSVSANLSSPTTRGDATLVTGASSSFQHKVILTGLSAATTYYFQVKSTDGGSNLTTDTNSGSYYSFRTSYDTKAPVISDIQTPVRASNAAVITWQTDELSSSQVEYGTTASTTSGSYAATSANISTPTIFHVVTLSSETNRTSGGTNELIKKTTYYFRVKSTDIAGNLVTSTENSFITNEDGAVTVNVAGGGAAVSAADTTPPVISEVTVGKVTPFGATITFKTNKETIAYVNYAESAPFLSNVGDSNWGSAHSIDIKGLHMGTKYQFFVKAVDRSGNSASSEVKEFKTTVLAENLGSLQKLEGSADDIQSRIEDLIESALPSLNPPFINTPEVVDVGEDSAIVVWTTNVKTFGAVAYSENDSYAKDKYTSEVGDATTTKQTDHAVKITNLKSNTKYHYQVKSYVFQQAPGKSDDLSFITKAAKVQAQVVDKKKDSFHVVWKTDDPTSSIVEYRRDGAAASNKKSDDTMTTFHDILVDTLIPGTTYVIKVYGFTKDGNFIEAKENLVVTTSRDTTPPVIASFKVDSALVPGRTDRTQTVVSWKTDEPATSAVYYEEGSGSPDAPLANKEEDKVTMTDNHTVILTSLKPGTIYRFQISSADDAGNTTTLPVRTIITPRQNESIVDVIFKNFSDTFKFVNGAQ